ncbi:MAG TPA: transposase [Verrucomicrobiae bacterium]|nr:transposase [Verrucomicrobiae bacterium]
MARKLRVEYPGAIYHVMNRGDRREPIFKDDQDRVCVLTTLGETCEKTRWPVHARCLMPNHFHLAGMPRKGRPEEGETAGSIAVRDERDDQMDCGAAKDGDFNARQPFAILTPAQCKMNEKYYNTRN